MAGWPSVMPPRRSDPLSSQGILNALRWGILASHAISDHLRGIAAALPLYERLVAAEYDGYLGARAKYYGEERRWEHAQFWQRRHEAITLDPGEILATRLPVAGRPARVRGRLGPGELEMLRDLCSPPRPAREVVAAFKARSSRAVSDRRLVLALQQLVQSGELTAPSRAR